MATAMAKSVMPPEREEIKHILLLDIREDDSERITTDVRML